MASDETRCSPLPHKRTWLRHITIKPFVKSAYQVLLVCLTGKRGLISAEHRWQKNRQGRREASAISPLNIGRFLINDRENRPIRKADWRHFAMHYGMPIKTRRSWDTWLFSSLCFPFFSRSFLLVLLCAIQIITIRWILYYSCVDIFSVIYFCLFWILSLTFVVYLVQLKKKKHMKKRHLVKIIEALCNYAFITKKKKSHTGSSILVYTPKIASGVVFVASV